MKNLIEREHEAIYQTYGRLPIEIERGEGTYIYDTHGKKYLDFISGIAVNALGHGDKDILDAIRTQIEKYMHCSNYFYQEPQVKLAELLKKHSGLDKVFFANSGAETTEGALKLMRKWGNENGRRGIYAFPDGFHGRTTGALSLMRQEKYRENMEPFAEDGFVIEGGIEELMSDKFDNAVGFVLEPIQGEGGIYEFPAEVFERLNYLQKEKGCIIVADEIQAGMGRTGKMFSYQHFGIEPDIVLSSKALGGGLPLGAMIVNERLAGVFKPGNHGTTFGGNAVACAAGIAVIENLESEVLENVAKQSEYFFGKAEELKHLFPKKVLEVRGRGLLLGMKFYCDALHVRNALMDKQVLTCTASNNILRILPPLNVSEDEMDLFFEKLKEVLDEI
jgi:predicted acetylornithine/succinylornithine family transaminase